MKKLIFVVMTLMLSVSISKADTFDLGDDFIYWSYLSDKQKIDLIIKFKKISNGAAYIKDDIPKSLFNVKECMSSQEIWGYYYEFEKKLEIFQAMFVCADKADWFNWPDLKLPRPKQ